MNNVAFVRGDNCDMEARAMLETGQAPNQQRGRCIPRFYKEYTRRSGGFHEVELVEFLIPGDTKASPVKKVTDAIREKYRAEYEAWRREEEPADNGTPLEAWLGRDDRRIPEMKANHVFTVEQLSELSDTQMQNLGMGMRKLVESARAFLTARDNAGEAEKYAAENAELREQNQAILAQLAELKAQVGAMQSNEDAGAESAEGAIEWSKPWLKVRADLRSMGADVSTKEEAIAWAEENGYNLPE